MRDRTFAPAPSPIVIPVIRHYPPELAVCRAPSCRRSIEWVTTEGGKRMPVDSPLLVERVAELLDGRLLSFIRTDRSHFATCPAAANFRKRKAARG
jgi:hypothetical protein